MISFDPLFCIKNYGIGMLLLFWLPSAVSILPRFYVTYSLFCHHNHRICFCLHPRIKLLLLELSVFEVYFSVLSLKGHMESVIHELLPIYICFPFDSNLTHFFFLGKIFLGFVFFSCWFYNILLHFLQNWRHPNQFDSIFYNRHIS